MERFKQKLAAAGIPFKENEPLAAHCTFKIGGPADVFILPESEAQLCAAVALCKAEAVRYYLLGNGSNILFADEGYRGAVIDTTALKTELRFADTVQVTAGAGLKLSALCTAALEHGLTGLEFAYGIPGTVGGAVYMNAGAYGGEVKDVLQSVRYLTAEGEITEAPAAELDLSYRHSAFEENGGCILSACFRLEPGDPGAIKARMNELMAKRLDKQPLDKPSAGSTFKRPAGAFAAALIDLRRCSGAVRRSARHRAGKDRVRTGKRNSCCKIKGRIDMELLIVSGLSGAGKSVAMNALEDIGFFCIDNVPAGLLPSITAFSEAGESQLERVALSMDVRGCRSREQIERALDQLDQQKIPYKILFLDAPDDVLMRRYSETRRRHPISISEGIPTREAFLKERQILEPLRERADYTINTALLSTAQNKERICDLFLQNGGAKSAMRLTVMSFGFKFGIPPEADLVLDVRCLPNPFYVPELKHKTGLDQEVVDFVMSHPEAQELLKRYEHFLEYALPLYVKEGKSQLTIAVGCTGGKHRSITFARKIAEYCKQLGYEPGVQHRDSTR